MRRTRLLLIVLLCVVAIAISIPDRLAAQDPDGIDTPLGPRTGLLTGIAIGAAATLFIASLIGLAVLLARRRSTGRNRQL